MRHTRPWDSEQDGETLGPCESYLDRYNLRNNIFEFLLNHQVYKKYLYIVVFYFALQDHTILNKVPNLTILYID